MVFGGGRCAEVAISAADAAEALRVAAGQAPRAMALMLATELLTRGRVIAGGGAVAHGGELCRAEELELPHASIVSDPRREICPARGIRLCKVRQRKPLAARAASKQD
ncbi:hypothetical protein Afe04nite_66910 [Asanoa ferruginea]|nr:hypothetical protein Afe04nite_66910 [Asanoa ferruginea]